MKNLSFSSIIFIITALHCSLLCQTVKGAGQCYDKPGPVKGKRTERTCRFVADGRLNLCTKKQVRRHCPVTCESTCPKCKDSKKKVVRVTRKQKEKCEYLNTVSEEDFEKFCGRYVVSTKCPVTCGTCLDGCKDNPNKFKYNGQRTSCEEGEDDWCNIKKSKFAKNCKKRCGICIIVPPSAPSPAPTPEVTGSPTKTPTTSTAPTKAPTKAPSANTPSPTTSAPSSTTPTKAPTNLPVNGPTSPPTALPTPVPTLPVTASPTAAPSSPPTPVPTLPVTSPPTAAPVSPPTGGNANGVFSGPIGRSTFVTYDNGDNPKGAGRNDYGHLGIGSRTTSESSPKDISLLPNANVFAVKEYSTCALKDDRNVSCMGNNGAGQLGIGLSGNIYPSPQQVTSLSGVTSIAAGNSHACAISQNVLWCWGDNWKGQNGNGSSGNYNTSPAQVDISAFPGATPLSVSCGKDHTCALFSDNKVRCWGDNRYGEIGADPDTIDQSTVPVEVNFPVGSATPRDVSCGFYHNCVLMSDGTISCWGNNHNGELGTGTKGGNFHIPQSTAVINNNAVSIYVGGFHSCALLGEKSLYCWGSNHFGQLGSGDNTDLASPTLVPLSLDVKQDHVATGGYHTCVVLVNGSVWCWGGNRYGELGVGYTTDRVNSPVVTLF